ncbi:MAG: hypothetical protein P0Y64_16875 [Candidatus Sphingomonas colombiensis]|nr:right-handed parallel beta-helix repeat-containing protein [Sphingomonas sp.]WEK42994.1 MAG: hypothetical protein P0Y64_16875 [Sphingomonas sp.]
MTLHILDIIEDRKVARQFGLSIVDEQLAPTLRFPVGERATTLPRAAERKGMVLSFDPDTGAVALETPGSFAKGDTGPSNNTRTSLAQLKAAATTDLTSLYDGSLWTWTPGDFTSQADDVNIVKANSTPLTMGAWVRNSPRRTDLAAPTGSSLIGSKNTGTGSITRSMQDVVRDLPLNPRDYGAIGDGYYHPLSERFGTLAAAQALYPFATALTQSLDWTGIQAALNEAGRDVNRRGAVRLPLGYFIPSDSLKIPNFVTFEGESRHGSVLLNQGVPLNAPQIVNADPASAVYINIGNLTCFGGTHAVKLSVTGEVSKIWMSDIFTALQTERCFEANKQVQSSTFTNCTFDASNIASNCFRSSSGVNNNNTFIACDFLNATDAHFFLDSGAGLSFVGCRFEGGGGSSFDGKRTLQFNAVNAVTFSGCYFEATHEYLFESASSSPLVFDGCAIFGAADSGDLQPYKIIGQAVFGSSYFYKQTTFGSGVAQTGANTNLVLPPATITSAANITIPFGRDVVAKVTGATNITSFSLAPDDTGRRVTLIFAGVLTLTDGFNLKLAGNFVTSADDTITLYCDGTNWIELGRSVN